MRLRVLMVLAAVVSAAGCSLSIGLPTVTGSGVAKEESRKVGAFSVVEVSGVVEATVTLGKEPALTLSGDDNLVPLIVTEVKGDRLVIRTKEGTNMRTKLPLRAAITATGLTAVEASGAATVKAPADGSSRFSAQTSGVAQITLGGLAAEELEIDSSGASRVTASGSTRALKVGLSGTSGLDASGLKAETASVNISGASSGTLRASKEVQGDVSGASNLTVLGAPAKKGVSTSGASGVTYKDSSK
jgi:hypothetical protein